jgi:hypothetical protein
MKPIYNWAKRCFYSTAYGKRQTLTQSFGVWLFGKLLKKSRH